MKILGAVKTMLFVLSILFFLPGYPSSANAFFEEYRYVEDWTPRGVELHPSEIMDFEIDAEGNIYVLEEGSDDDFLFIFTRDGRILNNWAIPVENAALGPSSDLAVDHRGYIYIVNYGRIGATMGIYSRVQKFNRTGELLHQWILSGNSYGHVLYISCIDVDRDGNVYVPVFDPTDSSSIIIQKYTPGGVFLNEFRSYSSYGDGIYDIVVDNDGYIYVNDSAEVIRKFSPDGVPIIWSGGRFERPWGIGHDSLGNLYVVDRGDNNVKKFTSTGTLITSWGHSGEGRGDFSSPRSIAFDQYDYAYVVDGRSVKIFKSVPKTFLPSPADSFRLRTPKKPPPILPPAPPTR